MNRVLVHGLAVAGASTVRALRRRGLDVVVSDDVVTDERRALAESLDVQLLDGSATDLGRVLDDCDTFCPAPGVPETHPLVAAARRRDVDIVSEIELAARWERERPGGPRPILAVTGTDGKTSTTQLTVAMLAAAGVRSVDAGNTDTPLVDAIDTDLDAFVVECSSFRLAWTPSFRADAAVWLNLQPDHLNWHRSIESYVAAKARIWVNQGPDDVAIGFAPDPVVMEQLALAPGRHVTFAGADGDYRLVGSTLAGPHGPICDRSVMRRSLPHDVTNALAASALVLESGLATSEAIAEALATFDGPPHRLELVGRWNGVDWVDDSKATTPHAACAAIRSFDRIVLIAGGADKGVDLSPMAADSHRIRAALTIGTTGPEMARVLSGVGRVEVVGTLDAAVAAAHRWAEPGDTVLLSPGCASLDQFRNFEARGAAFKELVTRLAGAPPTPTGGTTP